jgi:hypothetical protein
VGLCDKTTNTLNAELNLICHLLTLLGAHHILHVSRIRVNVLWNVQLSGLISEEPTTFFFGKGLAPISYIQCDQ